MFLFIKLFSVASIFILVCYIVGAIITRLFKLAHRERFFALFLNLIFGLSIIVSVYAVICTHGNTIQSAILVLILLVAWIVRYQPVNSSSLVPEPIVLAGAGVSVLPILLILVIITFCLQYFILYDSDSEYLKTPFVDYVYYSRLSLPLNHLGLETNTLEPVYQQFLTQQPYHYFEIWLNALLVRVTGLPSVLVLFISSASILLTIICVGFSALFAHFQLRTVWILVFALLFLFVTGIRWPFLQHYDFVSNGALLSSTLLCMHPKLAPVYVFMLLVGLLLLNRHYIAAGTSLAIMPLVFISTAPVAGISAVALASYLFLIRQLPWFKALAMVIAIVAVTLYIVLFYTSHPESYQFPSTGRTFALQSIIPKLNEVKTLLNITVGVFVNYAIYFGAYGALLLLLLLLRRQPRLLAGVPPIIWIWFGASLVIAAIIRAFGTHYLDSFQFFSNAMLPLTPIMLAIVLAVLLRSASSNSYFLATGVIVLLLTINFFVIGAGTTRYSPQFMSEVSRVAPRLGYRGAYVFADTDYKNAYTLSSDSYTAGNYISNFKNDYALMSLSALDIDSLATDMRFNRDSAQAEQIIRKSTLYRFARFQSLKGKKYSLDSIKYKFVTENNISFICASKAAELPLILHSLISVAYTDSLSGERLYLLNSKKNGIASAAYN